jgi:ABC-2 type transport system ATP-binding protein
VCRTTVIEAEEVSKHFGEIVALKNVSINIHRGEFFGLFGPNGAGKTTLLRILTGQIAPDTGSVLTAGISSDDPINIKKVIGIVPEAETPPSFLTAQEVLELTCMIRKIENPKAMSEKWLGFFEIKDKRDVLCRDLSKGQKQKLMLASAFVHEPRLLLLDEPFINLDPIFQRKVKDYLMSLVEDGRTIFMCTHILEMAEKLCTRIAIINDGQVGDGREIMHKDSHNQRRAGRRGRHSRPDAGNRRRKPGGHLHAPGCGGDGAYHLIPTSISSLSC